MLLFEQIPYRICPRFRKEIPGEIPFKLIILLQYVPHILIFFLLTTEYVFLRIMERDCFYSRVCITFTLIIHL